jgi:hypothetical protein
MASCCRSGVARIPGYPVKLHEGANGSGPVIALQVEGEHSDCLVGLSF